MNDQNNPTNAPIQYRQWVLNINPHQTDYRQKNVKISLISTVVINENKDQLIFACHACHAGNPGSIPGSGRSAGGGTGLPTPVFLGLPCGSAGKESACNAGDLGFIPGLGRSPGGGKGYSL